MSNLNLDKLIYLDLEFISRKYEELTGSNPNENITKHEGANAGIKAYFVSAGVTTQESRSYKQTSRGMLKEIWCELSDKYQKFNDHEFKNGEGTSVAWISGKLTIAEWAKTDSNEKGYEFLQLDHNGRRTAFVSQREYLVAGFRDIFEASPALKGNISVPVKCLARVLWHVDAAKNFTACPYVIIEESCS